MIRGTTPYLKFTIPYTVSQIKSGYLTFNQRTKTVVEKALSDDGVTVQNNLVTVHFEQKDTLSFSHVAPVEVQMRLVLNNGERVASNTLTFSVDKILKDGEI